MREARRMPTCLWTARWPTFGFFMRSRMRSRYKAMARAMTAGGTSAKLRWCVGVSTMISLAPMALMTS